MKRVFFSCLFAAAALQAGAGAGPEITWSVMHPTAIDVGYMRRIVEKAREYGGVDSFEVCGLEQKGVNALLSFDPYPHARARVDRSFVEKTRADLAAVCDLAHAEGKPVLFWHRENLVPAGIFEDLPGLLDEEGEFDLLGKTYRDYLAYKIAGTFESCPGLDGLVLTLTESEYSVIHSANPKRYPPETVVSNVVAIFTEELGRRGKRFVLRSFGDGADHDRIIGGALAAAAGNGRAFEIETKVTEADFVPWLPENKYLKRDEPLTLGAECDAHGEYLGAGYLPAAQVGRIREYVASARRRGASRYAIRIDRRGFTIFDSAHEVNLYAYMRFIREPSVSAETVTEEYARRHFGAAAERMAGVLRDELEMVRNINYVASNLTFHAFPILPDFTYVKAGGIFSLYREGESLGDMCDIWSILSGMRAPTHARILAEKDCGVRLAERGLETVRSLRGAMPAAAYARQHRAFSNAVALAKALRGYTRAIVAYFEEMAARADDPVRLEREVAAARETIRSVRGGPIDKPYLDGLEALCALLPREYAAERRLRRALERPGVFDFVIPGGLIDNGRVRRVMHAALPKLKADRCVLPVGNNRYPNGKITVRLKAPAEAKIDVALDPEGAASCTVEKRWAAGEWTVSISKSHGREFPQVLSIAAVERQEAPVK